MLSLGEVQEALDAALAGSPPASRAELDRYEALRAREAELLAS